MSEIKRFGIDVSHWQGDFDFARAKSKEGVEFAILKAGGLASYTRMGGQ